MRRFPDFHFLAKMPGDDLSGFDPVLCSTLHRGWVGGCLQSNEA